MSYNAIAYSKKPMLQQNVFKRIELLNYNNFDKILSVFLYRRIYVHALQITVIRVATDSLI